MAASTETNDVIKRMCELRIIEGPYRYNMVDIRLVTDLFTGDATVLARDRPVSELSALPLSIDHCTRFQCFPIGRIASG